MNTQMLPKKKLFDLALVAGLLFCFHFINAQSSFELNYATELDEYTSDMGVDPFGNILIVGANKQVNSTLRNGLLLKVYPDGSFRSKTIDKTDTVCFFLAVSILDNGNYFVLGLSRSNNSIEFNNRLWVVILDTAMNVVKDKTCAIRSGYDEFGSVEALFINDSILIAAVEVGKWNGNKVKFEHSFYRFTQEGDTLFTRVYPPLKPHLDTKLYSLRKMPNSTDFMLIGKGFNVSSQNELEFFDENLNYIKNSRLPWSGTGNFFSDMWYNDTQFLMTENRVCDTGFNRDYYFGIYRLDTSGNYYQELALNRPDTFDYMAYFRSMAYANDTTIYVGGYQSYNNSGPSSFPTKYYLYVVDKELNLLGMRYFGGDSNYAIDQIIATPDNGCVLCASRYDSSPEFFERDIVISKVFTDDMTLYTKVEDLPDQRLQAEVRPNPVHDELYVRLSDFGVNEAIHFRILDISGQKYLDQMHKVSGNCIHCNVRNLKAGVYVYEIDNMSGKKISGKFIKN